MKMSLLRNFQLQLYIAAMAVGIAFSCTELTILIDHATPARSRNPIRLDMWMPLPSYELAINRASRTILATNKMNDLKLYLDFSSPVVNSTQQILSALHVNSGYFVPIRNSSRNNRRFAFELKHILSTEIVKVEFEAASVIGRKVSPVSAVAPITFLYDSSALGVSLSTSYLRVIEEPNIKIVIEFTKPVFGFEASKAEVKGGSITRFEELSRALYSFTVKAESKDLIVNVPAGKVNDISGNQNSASNLLHIKHDSIPSLSVGFYSFMTVGVLATSLAAAILFISSANLEALATQNSAETVFTEPSMNLQGLFGHLQIFVLANWISDPLPMEYLAMTKGLSWLIPSEKLPWKNKSLSIRPSPLHSMKFTRLLFNKRVHLTNTTMRNTPFGQPLDSSEYLNYFLGAEPLSARAVIDKMEKYTGWEDLEMNLFWLGMGIVSLLTIHVFTLLILQWRAQKPAHGVLSFPRFELFLLILMLPCISQSSGVVIRGGTLAGTLTGILLLAIPAGFILSICLFLTIAIFPGSFVQYREVKHKTEKEPCFKRFWFLFAGKPNKGKWISKEGLPLSFLPRFGILFENRKGPQFFVSEKEIHHPNGKGVESGRSGVGTIIGICSDYSHEETSKVPTSTRLLGYAKSFYIVLDLTRRVSLGTISGVFPSGGFNQSLCALVITLVQFLYLITLKPYISRGVNVVEGVSLLSEAALFTLSISINGSNLVERSELGYVMAGFLLLTYVSQIANVWFGIIKLLLRLSHPERNSLKLGLKNVANALIHPFLPRQEKNEAMNLERSPTASQREPLSLMTATVLSPRLSPMQKNVTEHTRELRGVKLEKQKSEMKKLRQLAKASFAGCSSYEVGSTSYLCSREK